VGHETGRRVLQEGRTESAARRVSFFRYYIVVCLMYYYLCGEQYFFATPILHSEVRTYLPIVLLLIDNIIILDRKKTKPRIESSKSKQSGVSWSSVPKYSPSPAGGAGYQSRVCPRTPKRCRESRPLSTRIDAGASSRTNWMPTDTSSSPTAEAYGRISVNPTLAR
jgi:hypothetical protein